MQHYWDERARENAFFFVDNRLAYDDPNVQRFWERGESDLDRVLVEMDVAIGPGDTIVEVGCGVGRLTRVLATRAARVVALDVSEEMLMRAREHNPELHNVEWLRGDGTSLAGVPDASADAFISLLVFQHIPDPAITLGYIREIGRVLKPEGWAIIQFSNDPSIHQPRGAIERLRARVKGVLGRAPRGQDHPAWLGSAVGLPDFEQAAEASGLRVEEVLRPGSLFCTVRLTRRADGEG
jgi:ubiquinone/menaquinone biosynthesis C-methylase UbiE